MESPARRQRGAIRRPGAVKYGVLSLLCEGRSYSRELFKRFQDRVGEGWGPSSQSVYDALDSLEREGLARVVPGTRGKARVYYEVTEAGRVERSRWLEGPSRRAPVREDFYLKLAFSTWEDVPHLIEAALELERQHFGDLVASADPRGHAEVAQAHAPWEAVAAAMVHDVHTERVRWEIHSLQQVRETMQWMLDQAAGAG